MTDPRRDFMIIGGVPYDESCSQLGVHEDFERLNRIECQAYMAALRVKYGKEPEGARLAMKANRHDFGTYREVICWYEVDVPEAVAYAMKMEAGLARWRDVEFHTPVIYGEGKGEVLSVLADPAQWPMANTLK